ncbi:PspA/IM30 family protein [Desulfitobacterium chlororespirans]|uniref:Phage shock protein A (PspA) family protein n=1 Tax=Desulfitobacterium chlororespirans DSM 11544 TaxID=1121395 RepID=A0A1M7UGU0_9FIRM|nr:PspA/IM30 family protein [Desulfitobacterium chlororespirans]SHN82164.1 phage shock protein A (PspA) family protein [Desulfitobacterium chlororespirans DSM 11544]
MSILGRFKEIMSSNINALLDKVEDPEKMIEQCLRNLNSDLGKVKSETATIMAEVQRAQRELDECQADIEKMQSYALKALEAGNEADARKFLTHKASLQAKLVGLQEAYDLAQANAAHMRQMHDKLVSDIGGLESRKDMIKGKLAAAKTQDRMNKMMSSVSGANDSMASFERYEALADKALYQAKAMAELNKSSQSSIKDLAAKYDTEPDTSIDDELAALKASLNK